MNFRGPSGMKSIIFFSSAAPEIKNAKRTDRQLQPERPFAFFYYNPFPAIFNTKT